MRIDRFITLNFVQPWRRLTGQSSSHGALPVLMYHSISDGPEHGVAPYYRLNTQPGTFRAQMAFLKSAGCTGVSLTRGLELMRGDHSSPAAGAVSGRPVILTFDDGFHDFYAAAYPILTEFGFGATMFLPTEFIGETRKAFAPRGGISAPGNSISSRECLTWTEIHEMHRAGIEFGSHTVTHSILHDLSWPEIEIELQDSKLELEDRLGSEVRTFAYPYAFPDADTAFVRRLGDTLRGAGYAAAVTTRVGTLLPDRESFFVPRLPVNSCDDDTLLAAKLGGAYDWLGRVQHLRKRLRRKVRRPGPASPSPAETAGEMSSVTATVPRVPSSTLNSDRL